MGNRKTSQDDPNEKAKKKPASLLVSNLGWSAEEVQQTRARFAAWEEDWDGLGMEAYDHL
ncbi:MAG: hypothetical protein HY998_08170 [candidate division NC10 bacterium]|nr:hypothetical protein [candidate division NC10 bacterium]